MKRRVVIGLEVPGWLGDGRRFALNIALEFDPRDMWVGAYWDYHECDFDYGWDVYLCLVPFLPIGIHWREAREVADADTQG